MGAFSARRRPLRDTYWRAVAAVPSVGRIPPRYSGVPNAANGLGAGVANTLLANEATSRKKAGHLRASDQVERLLKS
jgi:hypothetical protein